MSKIPAGICACGCGQKTSVVNGHPRMYVQGHNSHKGAATKVTPALKPQVVPYGDCHCGCGKKTRVVDGHPRKYAHGHNARKHEYREAEYKPDPSIGYGYCHCGCGQKTKISSKTNARRGLARGKPQRYIQGHQHYVNGRPRIPATGEPTIGEHRRARDIGFAGSSWYQWRPCPQCANPRWIPSSFSEKIVCQKCSHENWRSKTGAKHNAWKGGRCVTARGYAILTVGKDHKFAGMRNTNGTILEHRLVMAEHLGRCLTDKEVVHHKNGVKCDNRIENLELMSRGQYSLDHSKGYRHGLASGLRDGCDLRVKTLKEENEQLKKELAKLHTSSQGHNHSRAS